MSKSKPPAQTKLWIKWLIASILSVQVALAAWSAGQQSPTYDEVAWVPAGVSHWQFGRFDLARVNPPLSRMVAAAPLMLVGIKTDWHDYSAIPGGRPEFQVGIDFMNANGARAFWLIVLARWACTPLLALGGWVSYRWATDLYGSYGGLLAASLWCFCPSVLAHGQLATADMMATSLGLSASYVFWHWLRQPSYQAAIVCGLLLGLAQLGKTTWLFLFLLWPLLWCVWRLRLLNLAPWHHARSEAMQLGTTLLFGLFVLNVGYGFEGFGRKLGHFEFVSASLSGNKPGRHAVGNRFAGTRLEHVPVLLPANYLLGIDQTKSEFERGKRSYLRGRWRMGGWWYYYLYGLAVKVPVGTWILGFLALGVTILRRDYRICWRDEIALLCPAAVLVVLVSSQTGFNHHVRYVLPALPFVFIWVSRLARSVAFRHRRITVAGTAALVWSIVSGLWIYPHSLSYFNELAGGPINGHAHLVDSNIDWGQDLFRLKQWINEHPEAQPLKLAYFGIVDPRLAGIEFTLPGKKRETGDSSHLPATRQPEPGWYAISVNYLRGYSMAAPDGSGAWQWVGADDYSHFLKMRPVARAGWSIYIYHIKEGI